MSRAIAKVMSFDKGDRVEWNAGGSKTSGTVQKKIMESTEVDGSQVAASTDDPRYLVKNDNTGKVTGHKPESLSPKGDSETDKDTSQGQIKFQEAVNMTAKELREWLKTEESQSVGQKDDDGEAIGHKSGKQIVEILEKSDYTEDDFDQMNRVVSYIHRHLAQKPSGDIEDTRWRYSLMNWGHDPLK